jgi:hypothetical protein
MPSPSFADTELLARAPPEVKWEWRRARPLATNHRLPEPWPSGERELGLARVCPINGGSPVVFSVVRDLDPSLRRSRRSSPVGSAGSEIRRRTDVVGVFPDRLSVTFIAALLPRASSRTISTVQRSPMRSSATLLGQLRE